MSLLTRVCLVILIGSLVSLLVMQLSAYYVQRDWLSENAELYTDRIRTGLLDDAYVPGEPVGWKTVQRLLEPRHRDQFRKYFRDVFVTSGLSPTRLGAVDLNPIGSSHRDPEAFPLADIRAGLAEAMNEGSLVRAADGFCLPITLGEEVVGGVWYAPFLPPQPQLPFAVFAFPVLFGTLLIGFLAYWYLGKRVVRPLQDIGEAASQVGAGRSGVRIPRLERARELELLVDAFNGMAEKVDGHRSELEHEVRQATEEAKRKERALIVSGRLASMGTLAAGIAHEINNPIGGMMNAINRIGENEQLNERDRAYVGLIKEGLERVGRIASRVLDFSPKQLEALPFSLRHVVEATVGLLEHRLKRKGVELRLDCPEDLPYLRGDRHEFQQVFINLFINSLDAFENHPGECWIVVKARSVEGRIRIEVGDNGPGMAAEDLQYVVNPFFSDKRRPDASGLGMFISYSIIENHGGEMELESAPGKGFRVFITMPSAERTG